MNLRPGSNFTAGVVEVPLKTVCIQHSAKRSCSKNLDLTLPVTFVTFPDLSAYTNVFTQSSNTDRTQVYPV